MKQQIPPDEEVVFFYGIVPKDKWDKVSLPHGSFAKALEIGEAQEICDMEKCRSWGAMAGISLARLGRALFPFIFQMKNPKPVVTPGAE